MRSRERDLVVAGAAVVVLTAGSVAAIAAGGMPVRSGAYGMHRATPRACTAPAWLDGRRVTVTLADTGARGYMMGGSYMMGGRRMMLRAFPQTVHAGTVSVLAFNHGTRTHEVVVLPLAAGATVGARAVGADDTVSEAERVGEASNTCGRGEGDGIRAGAAGWVTLTLKPGRYELVCNLPGHYAAGMSTELDVS